MRQTSQNYLLANANAIMTADLDGLLRWIALQVSARGATAPGCHGGNMEDPLVAKEWEKLFNKLLWKKIEN